MTRVGLGTTSYPSPDYDMCRAGCYIEMTLKLPCPDDDTCRPRYYQLPSPDDDTCRVGCEPRVQSVTAWREKKPRYKR